MKTVMLIWLIVAAVLLIAGSIIGFMIKNLSPKTKKHGYLLLSIGALMSGIYFIAQLFI